MTYPVCNKCPIKGMKTRYEYGNHNTADECINHNTADECISELFSYRRQHVSNKSTLHTHIQPINSM